jgi:hypothetical protein
MGNILTAEPFRRKDGSLGVAIYSQGIREAFGIFSSRDQALDWIDETRSRPNEPLLRLDIDGLRRMRRPSDGSLKT